MHSLQVAISGGTCAVALSSLVSDERSITKSKNSPDGFSHSKERLSMRAMDGGFDCTSVMSRWIAELSPSTTKRTPASPRFRTYPRRLSDLATL